MKPFDKAKNKETKKRKPWYIINTKKYSYHIVIAPIVPFVILIHHIGEQINKRRVWSEEKATKVLDAVLPKVLEWVEEDNAYYYSMAWGTSNLWRNSPRKYRKWAYKFEYRLKEYICDGYENIYYTKTIEEDYYETWVKFVEK